MKKRTQKRSSYRKVVIWGGVVGVGLLGYRWVSNLKNQFKVGKLRYVKKDDGKLFFELPIINDSILSPELKDFKAGILKINGRLIGDVMATPVTVSKRSTTTLQIQVKYKLWSVVGEFWQILIHNKWDNVQVQLTGILVVKQFITFNYDLDLILNT
jgi:hypothetical protein